MSIPLIDLRMSNSSEAPKNRYLSIEENLTFSDYLSRFQQYILYKSNFDSKQKISISDHIWELYSAFNIIMKNEDTYPLADQKKIVRQASLARDKIMDAILQGFPPKEIIELIDQARNTLSQQSKSLQATSATTSSTNSQERSPAHYERELKKTIVEADNRLREKLNEAETIMQKLRDFELQEQVSIKYRTFEMRAQHFEKQAQVWLTVMAVLIILLVGIGFLFALGVWDIAGFRISFWVIPQTDSLSDVAEAIVKTIFRNAVLISTLSFGLAFASRNYRRSRHNQIINETKATALGTFDTFYRAANDSPENNAIKATILLRTTDTIFSKEATGYMTDEETQTVVTPFDPTKIIDSIINIGKSP